MKLRYFVLFIIGLIFCFALFGSDSCFAEVKTRGLTDKEIERFSANNIYFYNPAECVNKGGKLTGACFKVSDDQHDLWYGEGCLNTGDCTSGEYYSKKAKANHKTKTDDGLTVTKNNKWIYDDTKVDEDFGGFQYIYAENYDYDYNGAYTKMTPNGGNSTRKYYWIALPNEAYTNGFGDTYVASFEDYSEPVYFIVFDAHACEHQHAEYCNRANEDPENVAIDYEFFGVLSRDGGSSSEVQKKVGKLKSFCRINGTGEVTAPSTDTGSSDPDTASSGDAVSISSTPGDNKVLNAVKEIIELGNKNGSKYPRGANGGSTGGVRSKEGWDKILNDGDVVLVDCTGFASLVMYRAYGVTEAFSSISIYNNSNYEKIDLADVRPGDIFAYNTPSGHGGIVVDVKDGKVTKIAETGGQDGRSGNKNDNIGYSGSDDFSVKNINSGAGDIFRYKGSTATTSSDCNSYEGDYPQYYQSDYEKSDHENSTEDWTKMLYGRKPGEDGYGKKTVSGTGCGLVSMAMLTTVATGKDVYPQDIYEITKDAGFYNQESDPYNKLDKLVGEEYGFEVIAETYTTKDDAYDKMKDYLSKGYMIHLSGECPKGSCNGFSEKSTSGHFIGLFKIDSQDNVWVANSNSVGNSTVPLEDIKNIIHNGKFGAIKGGGGSGDDCLDYCPDDGNNGAVDKDGLTEEQAKTFMMNYGANKDNSSEKAVGSAMWKMCNGGGSNCVTFSAFFISKFTSIGDANGAWGNGKQVVSKLKERNAEASYGTDPKVFAVLSADYNEYGHTAVVLGHHDGKWIVGHASCSYKGSGKGNGGNGNLTGDNKGGGSGFIAIEESDDPSKWQWVNTSKVEFAYPKEVDTTKIKEYLNNGT